MDGRQARGRVLAQAQGDRIKHIEGDLWFAPSSHDAGGYLVSLEAGAVRCGCVDFAEHRQKCKHIWAVELAKAALPAAADGALVAPAPVAPTPAKAPPPIAAKVPKGDLTVEEQQNVRAALRFLRAQSGGSGWDVLAKATRFKPWTLKHFAYGRAPSASLAIRLARVAGTGVDDLLCGRYPPTCPTCGQRMP